MAILPAAERRDRAAMTPAPHRVVWQRRQTPDAVTLGIESTDGHLVRYKAGQFNMLYAYAVGEVAISISGNPLEDGLCGARDARRAQICVAEGQHFWRELEFPAGAHDVIKTRQCVKAPPRRR